MITSYGIMVDAEPNIVGRALENIGATKPGFLGLCTLERISFAVDGEDNGFLFRSYDEQFVKSREYVERRRACITIDPNMQDDSLERGDELTATIRDATNKIGKRLYQRGFRVHAYERKQFTVGSKESEEAVTLV